MLEVQKISECNLCRIMVLGENAMPSPFEFLIQFSPIFFFVIKEANKFENFIVFMQNWLMTVVGKDGKTSLKINNFNNVHDFFHFIIFLRLFDVYSRY